MDWGLPSLTEFIPCCSGFGLLSGVLSLIVLSLFFWSLCCLSFLDFRLLVAPLFSYQLDQKCAFHVPSTNRTFPYRWCAIRTPPVFGGCVLQALVFCVVWYRPLLCPFSFGHCVVCLSERRRFLVVVLFRLWFSVLCDIAHCCVLFLLAIVLSVLVRFSASGCPFGVLTIKPEMF